MQYHLDGFRAGDPHVQPEAGPRAVADGFDVDVLIVGCGPAGLTLAAQLAAFPDIRTRIVEQKPGPLEFGQADGIACRTMEMFEAFGFAHLVTREAYQVNEVCFWGPSSDGAGIARTGRVQDVADDLSEMPHVILSQARVHDFYLDVMARSPRRLTPDYGLRLAGLQPDAGGVTVRLAPVEGGPEEVLRARYVVGCDGARSRVRQEIGLALEGASARQLWGVMDILAVTDFPDIRFKAVVQSARDGSALLIPREGGYMARLYIEMGELAEGERAGDRGVTAAQIIDRANRIFAPYSLDVREVAWWSAYEIGQRLCPRFDDATGRVFIAGDACHTHSPKAGQGMNVSMQDAFNLGWKLAAVLQGQAGVELLESYSAERQGVAADLIAFDRMFADAFHRRDTEDGAEAFGAMFARQGRYTAGVETCYAPSALVAAGAAQGLATGLPVGKRFHSAEVVRAADGMRMQLGHAAVADGRWRLYAFAGRAGAADLAALCDGIAPVLARYTPERGDLDAVFDLRVVVQAEVGDVEVTAMPDLLHPPKGRLGLRDTEKAFCTGGFMPDIYAKRGIDRESGCLVVVRPDQYVAHVLPLETAAEGLEAFLAGVLRQV